mgnify:FL=1
MSYEARGFKIFKLSSEITRFCSIFLLERRVRRSESIEFFHFLNEKFIETIVFKKKNVDLSFMVINTLRELNNLGFRGRSFSIKLYVKLA